MASAAAASQGARSPDVDWERIDKTKFFVVGTGVFSGITTCLFPLSVIKTRMMTLDQKVRPASLEAPAPRASPSSAVD